MVLKNFVLNASLSMAGYETYVITFGTKGGNSVSSATAELLTNIYKRDNCNFLW